MPATNPTLFFTGQFTLLFGPPNLDGRSGGPGEGAAAWDAGRAGEESVRVRQVQRRVGAPGTPALGEPAERAGAADASGGLQSRVLGREGVGPVERAADDRG